MLSVSPELINSTEINTHAFMTLSKIAFSSVQRLAALNLNATRVALEGGTAAFGAMLQTKDGKKGQKLPGGTRGTASNNALAYLKGVQDIAAETQQEVTELVTSYFVPGRKSRFFGRSGAFIGVRKTAGNERSAA